MRSTSILTAVLIGSLALVAWLGVHAYRAARDRRAVTESMLTEFARLAAWEYSRVARRDLETALEHTVTAAVHPRRAGATADCDCPDGLDVFARFSMPRGGAPVGDTLPLPAGLQQFLAANLTAERAS